LSGKWAFPGGRPCTWVRSRSTQYGGGASCGIGCGTAFGITGGGSYLRWLSFPDPGTPTDGIQPTFGPLLHNGSSFFMVTSAGGASFSGAVVSFSDLPPGP